VQGHEFLLRLLGRFESIIGLRDVILSLYFECHDKRRVPYGELSDQEKLDYEKHVDHLAMYRFYNDEGENSVVVNFGYSKLNSEHTILFPVMNHGELKQQRGQYTVHT